MQPNLNSAAIADLSDMLDNEWLQQSAKWFTSTNDHTKAAENFSANLKSTVSILQAAEDEQSQALTNDQRVNVRSPQYPGSDEYEGPYWLAPGAPSRDPPVPREEAPLLIEEEMNWLNRWGAAVRTAAGLVSLGRIECGLRLTSAAGSSA